MTTNLYALIEARPDDANFGKPFYVGMGTAKRPYTHFRHARGPQGCRNRLLQVVIAAHFAIGIEPGVLVLGTFVTKMEAGEAERAAIKLYGRWGRDPGGPLCNIAHGGEGPDSTIMNDPEIKAKLRNAALNRHPDITAKCTAALAAARDATRDDPVFQAKKRAATSATHKASWADPVIRARRIAALKGKKKTPSPEALASRRANLVKARSEESAEALSAGLRTNWQKPGFREKRSASQSAAWADPEKRANMLSGRTEGIAESWRNPEVRARRIAGIRAKAGKRLQGEDQDGSP